MYVHLLVNSHFEVLLLLLLEARRSTLFYNYFTIILQLFYNYFTDIISDNIFEMQWHWDLSVTDIETDHRRRLL